MLQAGISGVQEGFYSETCSGLLCLPPSLQAKQGSNGWVRPWWMVATEKKQLSLRVLETVG